MFKNLFISVQQVKSIYEEFLKIISKVVARKKYYKLNILKELYLAS